jgi:hypothetical protein
MRWREQVLDNLDILLHSRSEGGLAWVLHKIACPALIVGWVVGMVGLFIKLMFGQNVRWATNAAEWVMLAVGLIWLPVGLYIAVCLLLATLMAVGKLAEKLLRFIYRGP